MPSTLRDGLQIGRINRTKARVHAWWHANRCPACRERREQSTEPLAVLLQRIGAAIEPEDTAPDSSAPKH